MRTITGGVFGVDQAAVPVSGEGRLFLLWMRALSGAQPFREEVSRCTPVPTDEASIAEGKSETVPQFRCRNTQRKNRPQRNERSSARIPIGCRQESKNPSHNSSRGVSTELHDSHRRVTKTELASPHRDSITLNGGGNQRRCRRSRKTLRGWRPHRIDIGRFVQEIRPRLAPSSVAWLIWLSDGTGWEGNTQTGAFSCSLEQPTLLPCSSRPALLNRRPSRALPRSEPPSARAWLAGGKAAPANAERCQQIQSKRTGWPLDPGPAATALIK